MSNQVGDCFKVLWPFQNVRTLPSVNGNFDVADLKLKKQITCIILTRFFLLLFFFMLRNLLKLSTFSCQTVVRNNNSLKINKERPKNPQGTPKKLKKCICLPYPNHVRMLLHQLQGLIQLYEFLPWLYF